MSIKDIDIENEIRHRQKRIAVLRSKSRAITKEMSDIQDWINENCSHPSWARKKWADLADIIWEECTICNKIRAIGHVEVDERWVYDDELETF